MKCEDLLYLIVEVTKKIAYDLSHPKTLVYEYVNV